MKTDTTIEQLLQRGEGALAPTDKAAIKAALLAHAHESLRYESKSALSCWSSWLMRGASSFAVFTLLFVGTAYAAQDSMPGEPLYAMKVHVVETMIAQTKFDTTSRLAYDTALMEARLAELRTLTEQSLPPEPEVVALVASQIDEHMNDVVNAIAETTEELSHEDTIAALTNMSALAEAQVRLTEDKVGYRALKDGVEDAVVITDGAIEDAVADFTATTEVETVGEYLREQIEELGSHMTATSTDDAGRAVVEEGLRDAGAALAEGAVSEAIMVVTEVQQAIITENHIDDMADEAAAISE
jgi:hypothetical protein